MAAIEKRTNKKGEISYRVKIRMLGHEPETATFTSLTKAKRWAQDTESAMRDGRHFKTSEAKKHTLEDAIDKYIKEVLPLKPKNAANTKAHLLWWKEQIGVKVLADVTPVLIGKKRDELLNVPIEFTRKEMQPDGTIKEIITTRKRSPATVVRYLSSLSPVLSLAAKEWGWMEASPMQKVKKPKEPKGRVRFLSDDEREALLTACKASSNTFLYPITVIALSTGMRYSEIMKLTWDDVDFQRRRLIMQETKNGERRAAPLTGLAFDELKKLSKVKRIDTKLIFASRPAKGKEKAVQQNGDPIAAPTTPKKEKPILIRTAWETAIKKAGIEDFRFHDLRHSAASYLAMNGATLAEIAEVLGHRTLEMVRRYAHLSDQHVLGVVERMNKKIFGQDV